MFRYYCSHPAASHADTAAALDFLVGLELAAARTAPYVFGVAGSDSTALPVNRTGPVGTPVVEPPAGSSDTA